MLLASCFKGIFNLCKSVSFFLGPIQGSKFIIQKKSYTNKIHEEKPPSREDLFSIREETNQRENDSSSSLGHHHMKTQSAITHVRDNKPRTA